MPLKEDLESEITQILKEQWMVEKTKGVPDPIQLRLSNHAKDLETATVLYADLDGSTNMVDNYQWSFSAEIYKAYLRCAARIIAAEDGVVTAYDGDRIMAIFTSSSKNTSAVRAAMKINYAVEQIIQPGITKQYPNTNFKLRHVIGVDTSQLRAARIGVRGYNDLVWIGRAANYAAKLTNLSDKPLWITKAVYDSMHKDVKQSSDGREMWEKRFWTPMNNMEIYCSAWRRKF
ncbi:adenylate/guanylate cyclase domain-containing protein [Chromobacterium sp. Panama]|uniref:adenylate/guanylate cyclase domain-containing protein n=1 Tax=Chromobacterium sp. Panama TaxID=2161826 RepID=UPI000D30B7EB|nr:adenylate/guanylate cyclase domain-containing protein [Chromobacterium sp. Panama]PTU66967.1 adenylate/guanylate cyclase domain-containing protein [Chromobacterium sp. Panama]